MAGERVQVWPMVRPTVRLAAGIGFAAGLALAITQGDPLTLLLLPVIVSVVFGGVSLVLARRARATLERFAAQIPQPATIEQDPGGDVRLGWPSLDLSVAAEQPWLLGWEVFAQQGDQVSRVQVARAGALAREMIAQEGQGQPHGLSFDGTVEGPLHKGSLGTVVLSGLLCLAATVRWLEEGTALLLSAGVMVLTTLLLIWGARRIRGGLRGLVEYLEGKGHIVGALELTKAGMLPRWALSVSSKPVRVEGLVLGPLSVLATDGLEPELTLGRGGVIEELERTADGRDQDIANA